MGECSTQQSIVMAIHTMLEVYSKGSLEKQVCLASPMLLFLISSAALFHLHSEPLTIGTPPSHKPFTTERESMWRMVCQLSRPALLSCRMILRGVDPNSLLLWEQYLSKYLILELQEKSLFNEVCCVELTRNGLLQMVGLSCPHSTPHTSSDNQSTS